MIKEIILPELGEGIDGAEVSEVSVTVGDVVAVDETIIVLESDKASMEIPADVSGTISEILVATGDELKPGHVLMKIETTEKNVEAQVTVQKAPAHRTRNKARRICPIRVKNRFRNHRIFGKCFCIAGRSKVGAGIGHQSSDY